MKLCLMNMMAQHMLICINLDSFSSFCCLWNSDRSLISSVLYPFMHTLFLFFSFVMRLQDAIKCFSLCVNSKTFLTTRLQFTKTENILIKCCIVHQTSVFPFWVSNVWTFINVNSGYCFLTLFPAVCFFYFILEVCLKISRI